MFYLIGDIHGYLESLSSLIDKLKNEISENDTIIFLGDYIDRGEFSYEVIEFLLSLAKTYKTVFLKGNHEDMLLNFIMGQDSNGIYFLNGGEATIRSYIRNCGSFRIPYRHQLFFNSLRLFYEGDDFIAVHAGLNPIADSLENQKHKDLIWIRDEFYRADKKWAKTVIFGHTPTSHLKKSGGIYIDKERNLIGIDTGVIFGNYISCLRWPDRKVFRS